MKSTWLIVIAKKGPMREEDTGLPDFLKEVLKTHNDHEKTA